jgi:hypothetical protein
MKILIDTNIFIAVEDISGEDVNPNADRATWLAHCSFGATPRSKGSHHA